MAGFPSVGVPLFLCAGVEMEIKYSKQAVKFLERQNIFVRKRIMDAIDRIPQGDIVRLQGREGYRLRVGSYRIIFDKEGYVIFIMKIDKRGDVYKG